MRYLMAEVSWACHGPATLEDLPNSCKQTYTIDNQMVCKTSIRRFDSDPPLQFLYPANLGFGRINPNIPGAR
jgi:hypothetical protein